MRLPFRAAAMHGLCLQRSRLYLRPPRQSDWPAWAELREASRAFLVPWEPTWGSDALTRAAYRRRIKSYDLEWEKGNGTAWGGIWAPDSRSLAYSQVTPDGAASATHAELACRLT